MEKKHRVWGLSVLCLGVLCLLDIGMAGTVSAASPEGAVTEIMGGLSGGGGFGSTFNNQLGGMSKSLLTAAKLIAVIMTAAAGCMVCFGIQDSRTAFWNWILGIGLAINFGDLLLNLWGVESVSAPPKIASYDLLLKSESDPTIDILSPFMRYYIGVIMQGAAAVAPYAINLTLILALIDGSIRLAFDLVGGDKVKFLVTTVLKVGFFIFLIHSWVGTNSNYQLMPALSSGFETMGYTAGGAQDMITEYVKGNPDSNIEVQSNQIVTNALNFFNIFLESAIQTNLLTILVGLVCVVAAVIILFLTALEMFMVRIEFWTMALITIPLLPFGVIDKLKFLSDKAIGAMFNLAIKIFVIAFLSTMSVNILTGLVENAKAASTSADFMGNISYFLQVLLYALILFFLTKKIPALVSGALRQSFPWGHGYETACHQRGQRCGRGSCQRSRGSGICLWGHESPVGSRRTHESMGRQGQHEGKCLEFRRSRRRQGHVHDGTGGLRRSERLKDTESRISRVSAGDVAFGQSERKLEK